MVKSVLFLLAGLILNRYGSLDEFTLKRRVKDIRWAAWVFMVAGLALAGLPPFGAGLGTANDEETLGRACAPCAYLLFIAVPAVTGAAVLRSGARIFFVLASSSGETGRDEMSGDEEGPEGDSRLLRVPWTMIAPIGFLLAVGLAAGITAGLASAVFRAAGQVIDRAGYVGWAMGTQQPGMMTADVPAGATGWTAPGVLLGLLSTLLAVGLAVIGLYRRQMPRGRRFSANVRRPSDMRCTNCIKDISETIWRGCWPVPRGWAL